MKLLKFIPVITLIAVFFLMIACSEQKPTAEKTTPEKAKVENLATTPEDIKKEAKDLAKATMTYSAEQMAQYKQKITGKMGQYMQKQREIKAKLATMNEQAKESLAADLEDLKAKRAKMDEIIIDIHKSGGEAFEKLKTSMDNALEDMDKAYDQTIENLKSN